MRSSRNLYLISEKLLARLIRGGRMEVRLVVDGEDIEMNEFVTKVFGRVIEALVSTLKGVNEDWDIVKIEVVR